MVTCHRAFAADEALQGAIPEEMASFEAAVQRFQERVEELRADTARAVLAQKTYNWKMVTTWPPHFPVLGEGADKMAKWIEEMSDGRIKIHVYGAGELIPALECFEAASQGTVEMGHDQRSWPAVASKLAASEPLGRATTGMRSYVRTGTMRTGLPGDGASIICPLPR